MKQVLLFFQFFLVVQFFSCDDSKNDKNIKGKSIDYSNKTVLDSLIKATPYSNDTLFLGFVIGMTKVEYKNHIQKLSQEGKSVSYSKSNRFSSMAGIFELGEGYTFETSISAEVSGKALVGEGKYFLEPVYNQSGNLMQLNILSIEKWNLGNGFDKPNWLHAKVIENSERFEDEGLKAALINNDIIREIDFIRRKGNLIIYETILGVSYVDLKTLLAQLLIKETKKEIINENNKDIKF
jgi:hypothetical protein